LLTVRLCLGALSWEKQKVGSSRINKPFIFCGLDNEDMLCALLSISFALPYAFFKNQTGYNGGLLFPRIRDSRAFTISFCSSPFISFQVQETYRSFAQSILRRLFSNTSVLFRALTSHTSTADPISMRSQVSRNRCGL